LRNELEEGFSSVNDDGMRQMLVLAERLREQSGGELDDAAILAVSEATGATPEYVRLAVRLLPEKKHGAFSRIRSAFLTLEPDVRRSVLSAVIATICSLFTVLGSAIPEAESLFGTLGLIMLGVGVWNVSVSKETRVAASSGALFGGIYFLAYSLFVVVINILGRLHIRGMESLLLIPFVLGGGLLGLLSQKLISRAHTKFGIKDPIQERQDLLRQLVQLQDRLRSGEQAMTFLSLDIVGSTKMKTHADPLNVEFTFTEYHQFVETITKRYAGRVHSTAGDGVTCAFEHPQQAFGAARNIQAGLVELNTYRNKIGVPIVLRAGIHSGSVNAPTPEIKSLNFAHVIDVAAHVQHACPPGGIAVSDDAARLLPGGPASVGTTRIETDDCVAYVWEPRQRAPVIPSSLPPPPPQL
jgi:class 3 adenylate cyclase